jgi:hypothetical protein
VCALTSVCGPHTAHSVCTSASAALLSPYSRSDSSTRSGGTVTVESETPVCERAVKVTGVTSLPQRSVWLHAAPILALLSLLLLLLLLLPVLLFLLLLLVPVLLVLLVVSANVQWHNKSNCVKQCECTVSSLSDRRSAVLCNRRHNVASNCSTYTAVVHVVQHTLLR